MFNYFFHFLSTNWYRKSANWQDSYCSLIWHDPEDGFLRFLYGGLNFSLVVAFSDMLVIVVNSSIINLNLVELWWHYFPTRHDISENKHFHGKFIQVHFTDQTFADQFPLCILVSLLTHSCVFQEAGILPTSFWSLFSFTVTWMWNVLVGLYAWTGGTVWKGYGTSR